MLYPLTFEPRLKERVWGGRQLAALYGKVLPAQVPVGESWEISDRPGDISVVSNGPLKGTDLHQLVQNRTAELMGSARLQGDSFPLLIKILDAREKLSLQVHPPSDKAKALGGEPKTEMWYIAHAQPGAELFVGLKAGISREDFERRLRTGTVKECFHRVPVHAGDAMFLPSGRVHAIGAGLVIFEVQQNSDTTYRVFDWNRLGLDGQPRQLHIRESLASIDFEDFEPGVIKPQASGNVGLRLVADPLFSVDVVDIEQTRPVLLPSGRMQIIGVVSGPVSVDCGWESVSLSAGEFCLIPACLEVARLDAPTGSRVLRIEGGQG